MHFQVYFTFAYKFNSEKNKNNNEIKVMILESKFKKLLDFLKINLPYQSFFLKILHITYILRILLLNYATINLSR